MKKADKNKILGMLSQNLEMFYPRLKNYYMCPTCLNKIPLKEKHKISEAHIIPKAVGGKLKTFICRDCNSRFGSKQDKWFGDIIRIANDKHSSFLSTGIKDGYFILDGIKVNGHWKKDEDGNFTFYIHIDRNSPEVNKLIQERFSTHPPKVKLSVPLPILKNKKFIDIGFLTAGYLMWFGALGYSWVLQPHLDPVREQIMNPGKSLIEPKYLFQVKEVDWDPWFGIITIDGNFVPAFGIKKQLVVFPPRSYRSFYQNLENGVRNINLSDIRPIGLSNKIYYGPPVIVMFEDQVLVAPDRIEKSRDSSIVILFTKDNNQAHILTPVNKEKFNELKKLDQAKLINVKMDP